MSWSCNDQRVATAYDNGRIKIWESNHGTLVNELKVNRYKKQINFSTTMILRFQKHQKTVYVLECHPTNERLLCSAGHDGLLVIWDLFDGRAIKYFLNDVHSF